LNIGFQDVKSNNLAITEEEETNKHPTAGRFAQAYFAPKSNFGFTL